jgi:DNA repair photolyase
MSPRTSGSAGNAWRSGIEQSVGSREKKSFGSDMKMSWFEPVGPRSSSSAKFCVLKKSSLVKPTTAAFPSTSTVSRSHACRSPAPTLTPPWTVGRMCEHVFVRWDNLKVETEASHTLPGYREPATVRTFDAPEALDVRFYEIQAKSVLNRVPKASRMPFRWTINPYRGCTHACVYCLHGDTPILLADGRHKPLADLQVGDAIYGTERRGVYRRYVETEVRAHWSTVKPAYRLVLEDGTELVASGDHRFLTDRGWKFVTGAEQGSGRRPHLTPNDKLMGIGRFAAGPDETPEYRRGYLCGMIRGDGHLGSYSYDRPGRSNGDVHRFRLALADLEALRRTRDFLAQHSLETDEFLFQAAGGAHRQITAIRTSARDKVVAIGELVRLPRTPDLDWCKGFLAGIFDAEGSNGGVIRIANTDDEIIGWTEYCLRRLGFSSVLERGNRHNNLRYVRIVGGLTEVKRFLHTTDPAITRKRSIAGTAIKCAAKLRVMAIEPLGVELPLYDITTGTGDFIADGVVSHNCFARPTHTYLDFDAGRDFEREIVVKVNTPEVARAELMKPTWKREHVALGTNTDPYQWVEKKYELLPGVWEAMRDSRTPSSVLTKSPLLLRDIELFKQIPSFAANLSIPTLDEKAWRASEPHTPHPRKRIEAVAELNRAGIPTGVLIAPLMPGINDSPEQVEKILELCAEAGATSIGGICLHLRGEVRDIVMDWLRSYRPDLVPRYEALYARGAYAPKAERERLSGLVRAGRRVTGLRRDPAGNVDEPEDAEPEMAAPPPEQPSLF